MLYETMPGEVVVETNEQGLCVSVAIVNHCGRTEVWNVANDDDAMAALGSIEDFEDRIAGYLIERNVYRGRYELLIGILSRSKAGRRFLAREARARGFCSHLALDRLEPEEMDEKEALELRTVLKAIVRRNKYASNPFKDVCGRRV